MSAVVGGFKSTGTERLTIWVRSSCCADQVFWRFKTFFWSNEKNDSVAALSVDVAT